MRIWPLKSTKPSLKSLLLSDVGRTDVLIIPKRGNTCRRCVKEAISPEIDKITGILPSQKIKCSSARDDYHGYLLDKHQ